MRRFLKNWLHLIVPSCFVLLSVSLKIANPTFLDELQNLVFDGFQRVKPRAYRAVPVRVVDIDDDSLAKLGQWPWPRTEVARLVDRLRALGAKSIAFDIVFPEADRTSPAAMLRRSPQLAQIPGLADQLRLLPDNDRVLGDSIARGRVVAGIALAGLNSNRPPQKATILYNQDNSPLDYIEIFRGADINLPVIEDRAAGIGNFSFQPEADGVVRRVPMIYGLGKDIVSSLSLEALRIYAGVDKFRVANTNTFNSGISYIQLGAYKIPTDRNGRVWLYDTGPQDRRTVPAWKILLEKNFDPTPIRDNIVYIGTSAPGLNDLRSTPGSISTAGVGVHAQITEQILLGRFLQRPDIALGMEVLFIILASAGLIFLLPRVGAAWCGAIGIGAVFAALASSWYAFRVFGYLIDPIIPLVTLLLVYLSSSFISYLRTEADKKQIRSAFGQYLSPVLVEQLAKHPEKLTLGGEMKEMTLLFTDIRGFTTISEKFADNPHGLTQLINGFLTPMTEIILGHQGTVDKYMGDCIMAFWNAPLDNLNHAADACRAAIEMQRRLHDLNRDWEEKIKKEGGTFVPIHTGVGINTGVVCVGNMGSEQRFDYSVLGDDVNLASRLEGQSKTYGVDIVVGENTRQRAPNFTYLELDLIKVKGKTKPVRIFSLLGEPALQEGDAFQELLKFHSELLAAYREQEWTDAVKLVGKTAKIAGEFNGSMNLEKLYKLYAERIKAFRLDPPGKGWDGVFVATSK